MQTAATYLSDKLNSDLSKLRIEEAVPLTRALGHYLMLTQQCEIQHRWADAHERHENVDMCQAPSSALRAV